MTIRIVLADDHPAYRTVIREMLQGHADMRVVGEAGDGADAVRADREQTPDVVVLDIAMPHMDGIEATRLIVAARPAARVLALSLHTDACFIDAMFDAGATGYVLKQDPFTDLLTAIREVAAGRIFVSPNVAAPATGTGAYPRQR
jgi:two-component system response regulator NreC